MLHTKFRGNLSGADFFKFCFTINGHGNHHGHVTSIISLNLISLYLKACIKKLVQNGQLVS